MSLHFLMILIFNIRFVLCINPAPGKPVPHAEILEQILSAHITNNSYYNPDSIVDYILGNSTNIENLAINVLDVDNVRRIIGNARKQYAYPKAYFRDTLAYNNNSLIVGKAMQIMQQSIYLTRFRIKKTKPLREKYAVDPAFRIAVIYGAARQVIMKMDNLYAQLLHLPWSTHFIWFLVLYEKLLGLNVDINDMNRRIFKIHDDFAKKFMLASREAGDIKPGEVSAGKNATAGVKGKGGKGAAAGGKGAAAGGKGAAAGGKGAAADGKGAAAGGKDAAAGGKDAAAGGKGAAAGGKGAAAGGKGGADG